MKKLTLFFFLFIAVNAIAQTVPPQGINYQSVLYDPNGNILTNYAINVRITILSAINPSVQEYQEEFIGLQTNPFGLYTIVIGQGTQIGGPAPNFAGINWGSGDHFFQIEIDEGTGYIDMGIIKLWSVPYALFSGNGSNVLSTTQAGTTAIPVNGSGGIQTTSVTFNTPFSSTPKINATINSQNSGGIFVANVSNVSTTGFDIRVYRLDTPGGAWTDNLIVDWMAW
jgi:hypothetical protein